jgi:hypothetical protein
MKLPRVGRGAVADCELVWLRFDFVANVFEIPRAARAMNWAPAPRPGVVCRTFATLATLSLVVEDFCVTAAATAATMLFFSLHIRSGQGLGWGGARVDVVACLCAGAGTDILAHEARDVFFWECPP